MVEAQGDSSGRLVVVPFQVALAQDNIASLQAHVVQYALPRFGELRAAFKAIRVELPKVVEGVTLSEHFVHLLDMAYRTVIQVSARQPIECRTLLSGLASLERMLCATAPLFGRYSLVGPVPQASEVVVDRRALEELVVSFRLESAKCLIDCSVEAGSWAEMLAGHLRRAGIEVIVYAGPLTVPGSSLCEKAGKVEGATLVLMVGTLDYPSHRRAESGITYKLADRLNEGGAYRLLLQGDLATSFDAASSTLQLPSLDCRTPGFYLTQLCHVLKIIDQQVSGASPLLPQGIERANLMKGITAALRKTYAKKERFRRFMGEKVAFKAAYIVRDIFGGAEARKQVWIVGDRGSGKSTLCRYIAHLYGISQEQKLGWWAGGCSGIVWIPLKKLLLYDKHQVTLIQLVADLCFNGEIVSGLEQWLQSADLIYLLDGEEEVYHLKKEKSARGRLLKQLLGKERSIITSRTDSRRPEAAVEVELSRLSDTEVKVFVERYFSGTGAPSQALDLLENPPSGIREMMHVPLTLELICYRWSQSAGHSKAPIHLFQGILVDLCRLKAVKQGGNLSSLTNEMVEAKFPILPYLFEIAFQAKLRGESGIVDPDIHRPVLQRADGQDPKEMYDALFADETFLRRKGLSKELSYESYEFHHATFMDYCAARHLAILLTTHRGDWEKCLKQSGKLPDHYIWHQTATLAKVLYLAVDPTLPELNKAAVRGNFLEVESLLEGGADVNEAAQNGELPLHVAAFAGHIDVVRCLLDNGACLNGADENGRTWIDWAVLGGHVDIVKLAAAKGVAINQTDFGGSALLVGAAAGGYIDLVRFLLKQGVHVDHVRYGETVLYEAVSSSSIRLVKMLLEIGATVNPPAGVKSPLFRAAFLGYVEIVEMLLDKGALVDQFGQSRRSSLHTAAYHGHVEVVRLLVERGANLDLLDLDGGPPLYSAMCGRHWEVVALLLEAGAECDRELICTAAGTGNIGILRLFVDRRGQIDGTGSDMGRLLHSAVRGGCVEVIKLLMAKSSTFHQVLRSGTSDLRKAAAAGHLDIVRLFYEERVPIDEASESGYTPLSVAASGGHFEVVKFLLGCGANACQADERGRTPIYQAASHGHLKIVELLCEVGVEIDQVAQGLETPVTHTIDFSADNKGTALCRAALEGHLNVVGYLLKKGALVDLAAADGRTALHQAASKGRLRVVELLLEKGASVDLGDADGGTALHNAALGGHLRVVELLLDKEASIDLATQAIEAIEAVEPARRRVYTDMLRTPREAYFRRKWQSLWGYMGEETALHKAAHAGHVDVVRLLLRRGALVGRVTRRGWTPLCLALVAYSSAVVEALLEGGATMDPVGPHGISALHLAASNGKDELVRLFLEKGASIELKEESKGWTPLHVAVEGGHLETVRLLLDRQACIDSVAMDGATPTDLAGEYGLGEVRALLVERGGTEPLKERRSYLAASLFSRSPRQGTKES